MLFAGAGVLVLGVLAVLLWPAGESSSGSPGTGLPDSPRPALEVPRPAPLDDEHVSLWTTVRRPVTARAGPGDAAAAVAPLDTRTPEGTAHTLLVLGRRDGPDGRVWVHVRLASLPNGATGWVPRAAVSGYRSVRTRLLVDLGRLRVTLLRNGRAVLRAPAGVGLPQFPTPRGRFLIRNKLVRFRSPFYGPLAFGTSARSPVLTDWPDGGFVGIHGTNRPDLIPGRVSHGCIRLRNPDIVRLGRLMPVGTPVTIT